MTWHERYGVSHPRQSDCLFNRSFDYQQRKHQSAPLLAFMRGQFSWQKEILRKACLCHHILMCTKGKPRRVWLTLSTLTTHFLHYNDVIMSVMASQITSLAIVYSTVYSGSDQRKHQSSASLAFLLGIHRWPVNSPHKGPVTRKMFPFDDDIMSLPHCHAFCNNSKSLNIYIFEYGRTAS